MNSIHRAILVVCAISLLISLVGCSQNNNYWPEAPLDHDHYAAYDLEERMQQLARMDESAQRFWEGMETPNPLEQIQKTDPIDVGLHFAGYPNIDQIPPDQVLVFYPTAEQVIVIVLALGLGDDSVLDKEQRIDVVLDGEEWKVEWAGYRQRCARSYNPGWVTGLCP